MRETLSEFHFSGPGRFAFTNPLHPGLHPSLRQMDAEVVQMVPSPAAQIELDSIDGGGITVVQCRAVWVPK